jgi:hypothetical protein
MMLDPLGLNVSEGLHHGDGNGSPQGAPANHDISGGHENDHSHGGPLFARYGAEGNLVSGTLMANGIVLGQLPYGGAFKPSPALQMAMLINRIVGMLSSGTFDPRAVQVAMQGVCGGCGKMPTPQSDLLDILHLTLDVAGIVPVAGEPADGINAAIYAWEGDWLNATLSGSSTIPVGGWASTLAKWGIKAIPGPSNYRKLFVEVVGDLPSGWEVHHSLPQAYRDLFARVGINIDDPAFLRGVDPDLHDLIDADWRKLKAT